MREKCDSCGEKFVDPKYGDYCSAKCKSRAIEFEKLTEHMPRYKDTNGNITKAGQDYLKKEIDISEKIIKVGRGKR